MATGPNAAACQAGVNALVAEWGVCRRGADGVCQIYRVRHTTGGLEAHQKLYHEGGVCAGNGGAWDWCDAE